MLDLRQNTNAGYIHLGGCGDASARFTSSIPPCVESAAQRSSHAMGIFEYPSSSENNRTFDIVLMGGIHNGVVMNNVDVVRVVVNQFGVDSVEWVTHLVGVLPYPSARQGHSGIVIDNKFYM